MRSALLVDYFGVLTTPLDDVAKAWIVADNLDPEKCAAFFARMAERSAHDEDGPVHGLEVGTWTAAEFEIALAAELAAEGLMVEATGLLHRMFGGFTLVPEMVELVARVRAAGIPTVLVTNSFGVEYQREDWPRLFDATVISSEVGLRKPDPAIYRLALEAIRADPTAAVLVDDMTPNIESAEQLGIATVLHVDVPTTAAALSSLFDLDLSGVSR